jgi:type I restriction-modification system DNA methylase subunit
MDDTLISGIQTFTLKARADLEREAYEQLEGLYGWLPDGSFAPVKRYLALALDETCETRTRLEQYSRDEAEAGFDAGKARRKLVREAAFTWLNRFVAFKMLETRHVLKILLAPPERANAYILWLADERDPEARRLHDAGDTPVNALGEGPRQNAYRRFLLWQCGELAREMSVLFDPATLASRLCPRPNALRALVDALNAANLAEAWTAGNEETIGWVYEGFIEDDNAAVFENFSKGKKVLPEEIGAATQRFTPRWIVKFLVENSLGRFWMEMHPDSTLKDKLAYLVPPAGESAPRPLKPVREILFLDPCCGSMHFGLVAFDLFGEMYREEIVYAGQPGWPAMPSAAAEADIPAAVVEHNLHGIDIDPRAVQISALTLLIKARGLNPKATVTDQNLACCNVEAITGGRLDAIIQGAKFDHPVYERILRAMAARLKNSDQLGSLLRPERDLERLIDEERAKSDHSAGMLPGMGEPDLFMLDTPEKREQFFAKLASNLSLQLDEFVRQSRTASKDEGHFVGEASKGLNFLRLAQRRYDIVATNPPYMSRHNISDIMALYLDDDYAESKGDLYAAFIARCVELSDPLGQTAMVTQQSFMFISSYEKMRQELRASVTIQFMAHLGPRAFPNITGEKVNTTAFVFEKQPDAKRREAGLGVYFRLVKEQDAEAKRLTFESALATYRAGRAHPQVFVYKQSNFDAIPGNPWTYHTSASLISVFQNNPSISKMAKVCMGMRTGDNYRFLRYWWEVGVSQVFWNCRGAEECVHNPSRWYPYNKGSGFQKWHGLSRFVLNWKDNGRELKQNTRQNYPQLGDNLSWKITNEPFYFKSGVSYSTLTTSRFSARQTPDGYIFDVSGSTIFGGNEELIVALLNVPVGQYLLRLINPTINTNPNDIGRVPVPLIASDKLRVVVQVAVAEAKKESSTIETNSDFVTPWVSTQSRDTNRAASANAESELAGAVGQIFALSDEDLAAINRELSGPTITEPDVEIGSVSTDSDDDVQALELSQAEVSRHWISYAIGTVLGRFEIGKPGGLGRGDFSTAAVVEIRKLADAGGIMPCEDKHAKDIAARTMTCLNMMLGVDPARETIRMALGEGDPLDALRGWLDRFTGPPAQSFWHYHFQQYRKRPVYWPFQSPGKNYTVWVFHEQLGPDTLFRIRNEFVEPRLRLAEREIADLRVQAVKDRKAAKELDRMLDLAHGLRAFAANLKATAERGYMPQIDDGVLINAAPLHEVLLSWPDTRTAWKELEEGKYDWAHQAMTYWPDRVKAACVTNKSFAIAHGLAFTEPDAPQTLLSKRGGRKKKV